MEKNFNSQPLHKVGGLRMKKLMLVSIFALMAIALSMVVSATAVTCTNAANSHLTGTINDGSITIHNSGNNPQLVGLAVYKVFDQDKNGVDVIDDQELFDSSTGIVGAHEDVTLSVDLPECRYQIDSFCGPVLTSLNNQRYDDKKIDWLHLGDPNCSHDVPEFGVIAGGIALIGAVAGIMIIRKKTDI
jgi:hypothetical protein